MDLLVIVIGAIAFLVMLYLGSRAALSYEFDQHRIAADEKHRHTYHGGTAARLKKLTRIRNWLALAAIVLFAGAGICTVVFFAEEQKGYFDMNHSLSEATFFGMCLGLCATIACSFNAYRFHFILKISRTVSTTASD